MSIARILIVEDEFIVAQDIAGRLASLGYTVAGRADNAADALALAASERPNLVLMDIRLRGDTDGITAAEAIGRQMHLPVVFLTAYAEDSTIERATATEPYGYLLKPFEDRELKTVIEMALARHRADQENRRLNRLYATLSHTSQTIVRARTPEELYRDVCRVAVEFGQFKLAWIGRLDPATRAIVPVAQAGDGADYVDRLNLSLDDHPERDGLTAIALRENRPCIADDFLSDPRVRPWREPIAAKGFGAAAALPLHCGGTVWGALMLYAAEPGFFQEAEVRLVTEMAEDLSYSMDHLAQESRRAETEAALRVSEALYQSLVENLPQFIVRKDGEGRFTFANQRFCQSLGRTLDDIRGRTDLDLFPPALAQKYRADDLRVMETREPLEAVEENLITSGDPRFVQVVKTPLIDGLGQVAGVQGIFWDITELKRTEQQLRKLARAVDQSPAAIVITDCAGNIEFVNPKFTQVTGYTPEEALGKNPRMLKSGETPDEEYRRLWATVMAGQEWRGEFHNRRKDGTLFWEAASISPVRDSGGQITHLIAVKEDITERKLTDLKLLRAQRVESIGSLASGIAHDLNNILMPILMCASLLPDEIDAGARAELVKTIELSAQRAVGIVQQLLGFARGKEGQRQPVNVRHLLRDMVKIVRETFPRSIQVEEGYPKNLWPVSADATQIHQILLNLCVNARDAMPAGGRLSLHASNVVLDEHFVSMNAEASPGPHVKIEVRDTGTGIAEAHQTHIFESFFTTKGEGEGTGLGLATVRGIVKDHKGFISFKTAVGRGTTFIVHLPASVAATIEVGLEPTGQTAPRGNGEMMLVLDDEPAIGHTMRRSLERHGYTVLHARDGIEGLAQFSAHQKEIRAVITDFMMPRMDGLTFSLALRALSPHLPIVVSSGGLLGKSGGHTMRSFTELGVRHILHKPYTADVLLGTVAQVVRAGEQPIAGRSIDQPPAPVAG